MLKPYDQKNMRFWGRRYIYIFLFASNAFWKRLRRVCPASPSWADWKSMFSVTLGWLHRHRSRHILYTGIEPELRSRPSITTFLWIDPSWKITHGILTISFDTLFDTLEKYWQPPNMQEYYYIARLLIFSSYFQLCVDIYWPCLVALL